MEGKHPAGAWLRVTHIAEECLLTAAFIIKDKKIIPLCQMFRETTHVLVGLIRNTAKRYSFFLGLNNTSGLAINKEQVVTRSGG